MDAIRLDYTNALSDAVGEHGVTIQELEGLAQRSRAALEAVQARRGEDLRWMDLPYADEVRADLLGYVGHLAGRFENVAVLGIGGSALGTTALHAALNGPFHDLGAHDPRTGGPDGRRRRLFVLDNVDPDLMAGFLGAVDPARTLFNVISKSGGTAETMSQFLIAREALVDALGESAHRDHVVVTTDAEKGPLRAIADREGYRAFVVPDGVGGRFSVLSPVGLLPAALVGIDVDALCAGAAAMDARCREPELARNPAQVYAALQWLFQAQRGMPMAVTFAYSHALRKLADWYAQLLAESIGKRRARDGSDVFTGPTPVSAVGVTDQHSQAQLYVEGPFDKWFTLLAVDEPVHPVPIPSAYEDLDAVAYLGGHTLAELFRAERDGTRVALTDAGRPNVTVAFPAVTPHTVGQYLYLMEIAVALMGEHYGVDAFDQPGVEAGKVAAYALMGRAGYEERRREIESTARGEPRVV